MTTDTPRTDSYQYADYILNHYDRNSHMDKLCLARSLVERGYGRAEEAEAEVERLKANLRRAVEIAEDFLPSGYDGYDETIRTELDQIKATLNPTEK
jgi:hypothetical protein